MEVFFESLGAIAGACAGKNLEDLTEQEKVALAVVAGCAYRTEWVSDGVYRIVLANPVGFQMIGAKLRVCEAHSS